MGVLKVKSRKLFKILYLILGRRSDVEFLTESEDIWLKGVDRPFTEEQATAISEMLGYERVQSYLYNLMRRGGLDTWRDIADRMNERGGTLGLSGSVKQLSPKAAEAIVDFGRTQGLLQAK